MVKFKYALQYNPVTEKYRIVGSSNDGTILPIKDTRYSNINTTKRIMQQLRNAEVLRRADENENNWTEVEDDETPTTTSIKCLRSDNASTFFQTLTDKQEVFNYNGEDFTLESVYNLALEGGWFITYCPMGTHEYKKHGCYTCKTLYRTSK